MTILEKITAHKKTEVAERKSLYPVKLLERTAYFSSPPVSLKKYLLRPDKNGIIAEIKKRSPSLSTIHAYVNVEKTSIGYMQAGASALSVLTDTIFFGGSSEDLTTARKFNFCPILRKEFIIDEYQVIEAKSIGADAILLIAAILTREEIACFTDLAQSLGMEVLLELHDASELNKAYHNVNALGVNNRNLNTMQIDINHSVKMSTLLPNEIVRVTESGIESVEAILKLRKHGYKGFLIGSHFMKQAQPHLACKEFIQLLDRQKERESTQLLTKLELGKII